MSRRALLIESEFDRKVQMMLCISNVIRCALNVQSDVNRESDVGECARGRGLAARTVKKPLVPKCTLVMQSECDREGPPCRTQGGASLSHSY